MGAKIGTARGMRRKIRYGFIILGGLLFFSGMISYFELSRLSRITRDWMGNNIEDVELAKRMLDAVQEQNTALLQLVIGDPAGFYEADSILKTGKKEFSDAFAIARENRPNSAIVSRIGASDELYQSVVSQVYVDSIATDYAGWFIDVYKNSYFDLTLSIKNYMVDTQKNIDGDTDLLKRNAYRATMPGIVTLAVAILIVIVFYFLIDSYFTAPILRMNRSLGAFLESRIPYSVSDAHAGSDEVGELNDRIKELISMSRKKEK